jgi:hypothetical protein
MDRPLDRRARAGGNLALVTTVARLLAARWDPTGEFATPDGADTPEAHAAAVLGILAAGGRRAEVVAYLRRAEEAALGAPRSTGELRWALTEEIKALVLDTPVSGEPSAPPA